MASQAIRDLRKLTASLTQPIDLAAIKGFTGKGRVKTHGKTKVRSLFAIPPMGVVDVSMPQGEEFPIHSHQMRETFHVYSGKLSITMGENTTYVLASQQSAYVERETNHLVVAMEDSRFVCVTMPRDGAYPGP